LKIVTFHNVGNRVDVVPHTPLPARLSFAIHLPATQEDDLLYHLVKDSGTSKPNWSKIAYEIKDAIETTRTGKQCRERWLNHLRPHIHKGNWSGQEEAMIRYYYNAFGPK
jgi:hypothetical protein